MKHFRAAASIAACAVAGIVSLTVATPPANAIPRPAGITPLCWMEANGDCVNFEEHLRRWAERINSMGDDNPIPSGSSSEPGVAI